MVKGGRDLVCEARLSRARVPGLASSDLQGSISWPMGSLDELLTRDFHEINSQDL